MKVRWLLLETETLLRSLREGHEYAVVRDGLPADARVIESHACGRGSIAILVESREFDDVTHGLVPELRPTLECRPTNFAFAVNPPTSTQ